MESLVKVFVDVIDTDFEKTFNDMKHRLLLKKIRIKSCLVYRTRYVQYRNVESGHNSLPAFPEFLVDPR